MLRRSEEALSDDVIRSLPSNLDVFLNGLRTGGPHNGLLVDCVVVRSGEPFADGRNHLFATFSQTD